MPLAQPGDESSHDASFPSELLRRLGAALSRERGGDDLLERLHLGYGRDADARRLDDVNGWMRMPGGTWPGAAAGSFFGMWVVMMIAIMLPSLVPMLWRYRQAVGRTGETRLDRLTALVDVGYFFVWTAVGMVAFPLDVALARTVPIVVSVIVLIAGAFQLTAWKAYHLNSFQRWYTLMAPSSLYWTIGNRRSSMGLRYSS